MIRLILLIFLLGCVLGRCGSSKRTTSRKTTPKEERVTPRPTAETPREEEKVVNPVPKTGVEGYIET